jgi:galactose mutarotase-like enzyme
VFPYRHRLEMTVTLTPEFLTVETTVHAQDAVPLSFGFHPYFGIPGLPRAQWQVELPAMRKLVLNERGIPTGQEEVFERFSGPLGERVFDAGFRTLDPQPKFVLAGAGRLIAVEFLQGYPYAQVFAPNGKDFIALEPMTAPTNALVSGDGLRIVEAGKRFRAAFRVGVN